MVESLNTRGPETLKEIPPIYKIIQSGANINDIAQQIYVDFYQTRDSEKVLIGLLALKQRGLEGAAALSYLGQGSDSLGDICRTLSENLDLPQANLENLLQIKRIGPVLQLTDPEAFQKLYDHAVSRGYTNKPLAECVAEYYDDGTTPPQITETLEKELFAKNATFGLCDVAYTELQGPLEILRLRSKESPAFLLLGSLGKYSAREFGEYTKKINSSSRNHVIDIDFNSLVKISRDKRNADNKIAGGDARAIPFSSNSMDQIYTNQLFHYLGHGEKKFTPSFFKEAITAIFKEVFRVLQPGGSFIIMERNYGDKKTLNNTVHEEIIREIKSIALKADFAIAVTEVNPLFHNQAPESGSVKIDKNGFGHSEESFFSVDTGAIGFRFIKPQH